MELELKGKQVLITGGSKGIGLAVAHGFAGEGCHLHLAARSAEALEAARAAIKQAHGVAAEIHPLDLSDSGNIELLFERAQEVDILVNNAGAIPAGNLLKIDEATWREAWNLKVFGYINLTRRFLAHMSKRGAGVIVNVIGLAGEKPDYEYIAGSAGNASLMAFTRAIGSRSIDQGVRVLAVNPGPVKTDRNVALLSARAQREFDDPARWPEFMQAMPLGRAAEPSECADLVVFLASARASYLSGIVVPIDGGQSARNSFT